MKRTKGMAEKLEGCLSRVLTQERKEGVDETGTHVRPISMAAIPGEQYESFSANSTTRGQRDEM
jgi:hypothetical protein